MLYFFFFQFHLVVGTYAVLVGYFHLRRSTQIHSEAKSGWMGRNRDLLLRWLCRKMSNHIPTSMPCDPNQLGQPPGKSHDTSKSCKQKSACIVLEYRGVRRISCTIHANFFDYNDFVCSSNSNKWIYRIIPVR